MYNTRRSGGNNQNNQHNFRQQQQPTMPHVATFITQKTNPVQMQHQNHQPAVQNMPLHNLPQQPQGPQTPIQTPIPTLSTQFPPDTFAANAIIKHEEVSLNEEVIIDEKTDVKWPPKRKANKKEQKKRLNARMRRLVCPKSPLMVFSELYKDVPIKLDETPRKNSMSYTASFEIDGKVYTGEHVSKTQAKQKACENFLRVLLANKIKERSEKKDTVVTDMEMEGSENGTTVKPKGPPQEDFPWPHFASLAMHNLINHWELQPITKAAPDETSVKATPKVGAMKKFPDNPEIYNPVQLLHQMSPGIQFVEKTISATNPSLFETSCVLNDKSFMGQGSTKKGAKKECAIAAIKSLWNFDFHAIASK